MSKNRTIWEFFYPIFTYISLICFSLCFALLSVETDHSDWLDIPTSIEWPLRVWFFGNITAVLWAKAMSELNANDTNRGNSRKKV